MKKGKSTFLIRQIGKEPQQFVPCSVCVASLESFLRWAIDAFARHRGSISVSLFLSSYRPRLFVHGIKPFRPGIRENAALNKTERECARASEREREREAGESTLKLYGTIATTFADQNAWRFEILFNAQTFIYARHTQPHTNS